MTVETKDFDIKKALKVISGTSKGGIPYSMLVVDRSKMFNSFIVSAAIAQGVEEVKLTNAKK